MNLNTHSGIRTVVMRNLSLSLACSIAFLAFPLARAYDHEFLVIDDAPQGCTFQTGSGSTVIYNDVSTSGMVAKLTSADGSVLLATHGDNGSQSPLLFCNFDRPRVLFNSGSTATLEQVRLTGVLAATDDGGVDTSPFVNEISVDGDTTSLILLAVGSVPDPNSQPVQVTIGVSGASASSLGSADIVAGFRTAYQDFGGGDWEIDTFHAEFSVSVPRSLTAVTGTIAANETIHLVGPSMAEGYEEGESRPEYNCFLDSVNIGMATRPVGGAIDGGVECTIPASFVCSSSPVAVGVGAASSEGATVSMACVVDGVDDSDDNDNDDDNDDDDDDGDGADAGGLSPAIVGVIGVAVVGVVVVGGVFVSQSMTGDEGAAPELKSGSGKKDARAGGKKTEKPSGKKQGKKQGKKGGPDERDDLMSTASSVITRLPMS